MKKLSTTKTLLATLGLIGATSLAFAGVQSMGIDMGMGDKHHANKAVLATQAKITLNQAIDLAKAKVPADMQAHLTSAKFKGKKGGQYEVEFSNGTTSQEINLSASTGEVLKTEQEKMDEKDVAEYNAFLQAKVTLDQAMSQAGQVGQVIKGEFELENNVATYELEVIKDKQVYEVILDANTGAVLSQTLDAEHEKHDKKGNHHDEDKGHKTV